MNDSSPLTTESPTVPSANPMRFASSTAKITRSSASTFKPPSRPCTRTVEPALTSGVPSASKRCSAMRLGGTIGLPSSSKLTPEYPGADAGRTSATVSPPALSACHDSSDSPAVRKRSSPLPRRQDSSAGRAPCGGYCMRSLAWVAPTAA